MSAPAACAAPAPCAGRPAAPSRPPPQAAFLRASGAFARTHNKRRDEFVDYVEKAIRLGHRLGHRDGAASGGGGKGKH